MAVFILSFVILFLSFFFFFSWVHAHVYVRECACVWEGSNICVWSRWRCVGVQNPMVPFINNVFLGSLRPHACRWDERLSALCTLWLSLIRLPLTALLSGWHRIKDVCNWLGKAVIYLFTAPAWNGLHIFPAEPCQGFNYWHVHLERGWYWCIHFPRLKERGGACWAPHSQAGAVKSLTWINYHKGQCNHTPSVLPNLNSRAPEGWFC